MVVLHGQQLPFRAIFALRDISDRRMKLLSEKTSDPSISVKMAERHGNEVYLLLRILFGQEEKTMPFSYLKLLPPELLQAVSMQARMVEIPGPKALARFIPI